VTPNRVGVGPGGLESGFMSVKFRVQSAFNFSSDSYAIVFNTSGSGQTPWPQTFSNNFAGYSMSIVRRRRGAARFRRKHTFTTGPTRRRKFPSCIQSVRTPQQLIFQPNTNGQGTEIYDHL
jgi:hypothetical protein